MPIALAASVLMKPSTAAPMAAITAGFAAGRAASLVIEQDTGAMNKALVGIESPSPPPCSWGRGGSADPSQVARFSAPTRPEVHTGRLQGAEPNAAKPGKMRRVSAFERAS